MFYLIICLFTAGVVAGLVNFFYSYLSLPTKHEGEPQSFDETGDPWGLPVLTWQLAITGYIITGIAGAFLTPLINAILTLKGVEDGLDKALMVAFGYGIVFGFSTNRMLNSLTNSILAKIEKLLNETRKNERFRSQLLKQQEFLNAGDSLVCPTTDAWEMAPNYNSKPLAIMAWATNLKKDKFGCTRDGGSKFHGGIDIGAEEGTECYALADGVITDIGSGSDLGKYIALQFKKDGNTYGAGYCHLSEIKVKKGDNVTSGQIIGETGKTGNVGNDKAHLHLEIHKTKWLTYTNIEDRSKASLDPNHYIQ